MKMWLIHSFILILLANLLVIREVAANEKPEVLIIGAGAAGIAAASKLSKHNFPVKILEAENRLGGRIHSVKFGGDNNNVDLGAEWVLASNNPAYQLIEDKNILGDFDFNFTFYKSDQSKPDEELCLQLLAVYATLTSPNVTEKAPEDLTLGSYFIDAFRDTAKELYGSEPEKYRLAIMYLNAFEKIATSDCGALNWFDASLRTSYIDEEDTVLHFNGKGFKVVLDRMLADGPAKDKIFFKKVVKQINHSMDEEVEVVCQDGSKYKAKHVIFTPSLGVLKEQHKNMFVPGLSAQKVEAIDAYGYGVIMKVVVHFADPWWTEDKFTGFSFVWTFEDRETLVVDYPDAVDENYDSWLRDIMGVFPQPGSSNIACLFAGSHIKRMEGMSDNQLIEGITYILDRFVGHKYNVTKPDNILRENWYSNPHFRGAFSYERIQSRNLKLPPMTTLEKPIANKNGVPRVLFAGEATHLSHYSTVHGAIETGYREANKIIELYENNV